MIPLDVTARIEQAVSLGVGGYVDGGADETVDMFAYATAHGASGLFDFEMATVRLVHEWLVA
jgi:hypothetical protein